MVNISHCLQGIHRCQGAWKRVCQVGSLWPPRSSVAKWWKKPECSLSTGMGSTYIQDGSMCHVTTSKKHRNYKPHLTNWPGQFWQVRYVGELCQQKPLSYSRFHRFNFQLSDLNLWQLWEWMFFNTKPTETNLPAGMVCLVLPGLLFFYTCRMQCRAKVGGLQQSLLSKGRGVCQLCPGSGWVGLEGLDEMIACCWQVMERMCHRTLV